MFGQNLNILLASQESIVDEDLQLYDENDQHLLIQISKFGINFQYILVMRPPIKFKTLIILFSLLLVMTQQECPTIIGCIQCLDPVICDTCNINNHFQQPAQNGQCNCQQSFFLNADQLACQICSVVIGECIHCISDEQRVTSCTDCQKGYYLNENVCRKCSQLDPHCVNCSNDSACNLCETGYFLDALNQCTECNQMTQDCIECTIDNCSKCANNFYLKNISYCEYCSVPIPNCLNCNDNQSCVYCQADYFLQSNTECLNCSFIDVNCTHCQNDGNCTACEKGTFLNQSLNSCPLCHVFCIDCQSLEVCSECAIHYFLNYSSCVLCVAEIPHCSQCASATDCFNCATDSAFSEDKTCQLCIETLPFCERCESVEVCTECSAGKQLKDGECIDPASSSTIIIIAASVGGVLVISISAFLIIKRVKSKRKKSLMQSRSQSVIYE